MPDGSGTGTPAVGGVTISEATTPIRVTTSEELVGRVRSNINEPAGNADPQRSDPEIAQWLQDGLWDYVSKIPADAVPELVTFETFSGTAWAISNNFVKLLHAVIDHNVTPSGATQTTLLSEQCKILDSDEEYAALNAPSWAGAWAKFDKVGSQQVLRVGPNPVSGTITYIGLPSPIESCNVEFPINAEHEEPIVNYASAMACRKINDADANAFLERYEMRVAAEQGVKYTRRRKVEKEDPQVNE